MKSSISALWEYLGIGMFLTPPMANSSADEISISMRITGHLTSARKWVPKDRYVRCVCVQG